MFQRLAADLLPLTPSLTSSEVARCTKSFAFLKWLSLPLFEAFTQVSPAAGTALLATWASHAGSLGEMGSLSERTSRKQSRHLGSWWGAVQMARPQAHPAPQTPSCPKTDLEGDRLPD